MTQPDKDKIIANLHKQINALQAELAILKARLMAKKKGKPKDDSQLELPLAYK